MEERMTVCNMSIEAGARAGMIAPDETTFAWLEGRKHAPKGAAFEAAKQRWAQLKSDPDAKFDAEVHLDASKLAPMVTWGDSPDMAAPIDASARARPKARPPRRSPIWGLARRSADGRDHRCGLYRLVHQCAPV
jgi:3-isopropylmalate/(R)-2-methylmalate dehydratase large subunit